MESKKIEIYGLKMAQEIDQGVDLAKLISETADEQANGICENDVIVITGKIVSKAEGRQHKLEEVEPSKKAVRLSRWCGIPPREVELYLRAGEIRVVIPVRDLAKRHGQLFKQHTTDEKAAEKVIQADPYMFLIDVDGQLLTWGGIDFSNSPEGYYTALPLNPDESARRIKERIRELTDKDVAVIIADTEVKIDKFGTMDIAIGSSGIQPVSREFASPDLYGKPKFGGVDDMTDLCTASANLLFGQTSAGSPVAIIRGLTYERSQKGIRDAAPTGNIIYDAIGATIWQTVKFRFMSKLASIL